jgi:hypothetical protein
MAARDPHQLLAEVTDPDLDRSFKLGGGGCASGCIVAGEPPFASLPVTACGGSM